MTDAEVTADGGAEFRVPEGTVAFLAHCVRADGFMDELAAVSGSFGNSVAAMMAVIMRERTERGQYPFPNPASGPITIRLNADHQETTPCLVFDVTGHLVYTHELLLDAGSNTLLLNLPLSSGLYFMKIGPVVTKIVLR